MRSAINITVVRKNNISALSDCYATPPYKVLSLPVIRNDWQRRHQVLNLMQMCSSPGFLAGDDVEIDINVESSAGLQLHTQSFSRVLSMNKGQIAHQKISVTLADDARFCYVPLPLVLHAGSSFHQRIHIDMGERSELIMGEVIASGRKLTGENFAYDWLSSQIRFCFAGRLFLFDNLSFHPQKKNVQAIGQMEQYTHQASWYYINTAPNFSGRQIYDAINALMNSCSILHKDALLAGVTQPTRESVVVRGLAPNSEMLQQLLEQCTQCVMAI